MLWQTRKPLDLFIGHLLHYKESLSNGAYNGVGVEIKLQPVPQIPFISIKQ